MVEEEIAFVKVQPRKGGSVMITIPAEAVKILGIKDKERAKVYVDVPKRRVIFEVLKG